MWFGNGACNGVWDNNLLSTIKSPLCKGSIRFPQSGDACDECYRYLKLTRWQRLKLCIGVMLRGSR